MSEEKSLQQRLMDAMREMSNPVKNSQGYNYRYAQLDQVMSIVRLALETHGLCVRQCQKPVDDYSAFVLETVVFDGNEEKVVDVRPIIATNNPQTNGSYETYSRRYALLTAFGLAPEDDDAGGANYQQPQKNYRYRGQ